MADRIKRLENLFLTEIAGFISKHHTDKFTGLITITSVKISKNLQSAKVYYSVLGQTAESACKERVLANVRYELTHYLAKRLNIRRIPSLIFEFDTTAANASKIETVFKKIREEK
jgi:ribosome-binding factor A